MNKAQAEIDLFMRKCDEVATSGFILADTKIGELLKSVVTSDVLYALFRRALIGFDYAAAWQACAQGQGRGGRLLFPEDPAQKLAFIFCLLVDLDNKRIDLSELLQEYFRGDGSLYESYYSFCNQVIKPMRGIVRSMLQGGAPLPAAQRPLPRSLVQAERDLAAKGSADLVPDSEALLYSVSVKTHTPVEDIYQWTVRRFVLTERAIDRTTGHIVAALSEAAGAKYKNGNPWPSWKYDRRRQSGALVSLAELTRRLAGSVEAK